MKKLIIAPLLLAAMFAISSGTTATPASAEPAAAPEIGGCRWFCGSKPNAFQTARECERVCTSFCEPIC